MKTDDNMMIRRLISVFLCFCVCFSCFGITASAAGTKTFVDGKVYEFDKDNEYNFSGTTSCKSSADTTTYGQFSITGTESELVSNGKKNVETQFFLLAFALNIQKLCNREKKGRIGLDLFPLNAS